MPGAYVHEIKPLGYVFIGAMMIFAVIKSVTYDPIKKLYKYITQH